MLLRLPLQHTTSLHRMMMRTMIWSLQRRYTMMWTGHVKIRDGHRVIGKINDSMTDTNSIVKKNNKKHRSSSSSSSDGDADSSGDGNSSDDDYGTSSDNGGSKKKKKVKKKKTTTNKSVAAPRRARNSSSAEPFAQLVSAAIKSHKKQEQSKLIDSLKSDVMGILQARLLGGDATKKDSSSGSSASALVPGSQHSSMRRDYVKRIRSAYKDMKHDDGGVNISGKFGSDEHKSNISSLFTKLDQVHDVELRRIPHVDEVLDIDNVLGKSATNRMKITKLSRKHIQSSPDKVISEAEYNSLTDAYGACILYRYFFSLLKPYLDIPYVN